MKQVNNKNLDALIQKRFSRQVGFGSGDMLYVDEYRIASDADIAGYLQDTLKIVVDYCGEWVARPHNYLSDKNCSINESRVKAIIATAEKCVQACAT